MWCATWVDNERNIINWAYCNAICPVEIPSSTIAAKVTIPIVIIIVIAIVVYWYKKRQKQTTMNANMNKYSNVPVNEQAADMAYNGKYQIDRSKFDIGRKLGGGSFGSVYEGTTEDLIHPGQEIKIAIKSVNNPLDPTQIYAMMCEIKVLDKLEMNLNLVNMIGACTTEFKSGRIWLLLEHCSHGDMKNFLLKNSDVICQGLHYQSTCHQTLNIRLFLKWSHGICKGMKYLASKNIMHGDLAARNILITNFNNDERYLAKVCDFGLSKAFYDKTSYHKQERKNIPWKWMAVDYFKTGVLTVNSDVWSFGVVLWEMLSMGSNPYAGGDPDDTIKKIKAGFRLPVPDEVKEANWIVKCYDEVTEKCWQLDPKKRCNFSDLTKIFETLLTTEEKENYKRLEQTIINNKAEQEISYDNRQDDIEAVCSNAMADVIELNYTGTHGFSDLPTALT